MSSYHSSFSYLGKNSASGFNWIISHFDADNGESETGFATESIYTASPDGTSRNLYGTKYSGPEPVRITVIKPDGADWTVADNRLALKWLTGAKSDSWLDLYIGDEVKYRMLGHVQNVLQYKMDARIVGLVIVFESASPFAFSSLQTVSHSISNKSTFSIDNPSDDNYTFVKMKTTYKNTSGNAVTIANTTTGETTIINNLVANETVTLNNNQSITSDKPSRILGNDFNFCFPRLAPGVNNFTVTGTGDITFEYVYFIKIGDMATEINAVSDPICDDFGNIQIDMLDWSRISNTPTTASGYGLTDVYTVSAVYNKNEINEKIDEITDKVDSTASLISTVSSELSDDYYDKTEIDNIVSGLTYNPSTGAGLKVIWSQIEDKPTTLSEYRIKTEVQELIDESKKQMLANDIYTKNEVDTMLENFVSDEVYTKSEVDALIAAVQIDIDEVALNAMLAEVLEN